MLSNFLNFPTLKTFELMNIGNTFPMILFVIALSFAGKVEAQNKQTTPVAQQQATSPKLVEKSKTEKSTSLEKVSPVEKITPVEKVVPEGNVATPTMQATSVEASQGLAQENKPSVPNNTLNLPTATNQTSLVKALSIKTDATASPKRNN